MSKVHSGQRFIIRELRDELGIMIIGQTRCDAQSNVSPETLQITPFGQNASVDVLLAQKLSKSWT
jgi:hypothetical protein